MRILRAPDRPGYAVLRMVGELHPDGLAAARSELIRALRLAVIPPRPAVVILDLEGVATISPPAVAVFAQATTALGGWPRVQLALARAQPSVARILRVSGASKFLVVRDTVAQAAADAPAGPRVLRVNVPVAADEDVAAVAARMADIALGWGEQGRADEVLAVTRDLLDAARSGGPPRPLTAKLTRRGGRLYVDVVPAEDSRSAASGGGSTGRAGRGRADRPGPVEL